MKARSIVGLRCIAYTVACILTGCQPPPRPVATAPVLEVRAVDGVGYIVLTAPISAVARDLFKTGVEKLRSTGATEIHLAINTYGGNLEAAREMADYMAQQHSQDGMVFKAYNTGKVGSPASLLFLTAQSRYSVAAGTIWFQTPQVTSPALVNSTYLHEAAEKLDAFNGSMLAALVAHTKLKRPEAEVYVNRGVVLNSDDARRDGIVDAVAPFIMPAGSVSWTIYTKPPTTPPARTAAPAASPLNG